MGRASACAISGLPISAGDQTLLIPLALCEENGRAGAWRPIAAPIEGSYDEDYWTIRPSEDPSATCKVSMGILGVDRIEQLSSPHGSIACPADPESLLTPWLRTSYALARRDAWDALLSLPQELSEYDAKHGKLASSCFATVVALAAPEARAIAQAYRDDEPRARAEYAQALEGADPGSRAALAKLMPSGRFGAPKGLPPTPHFDFLFERSERIMSMPASPAKGIMADPAIEGFWRRAIDGSASLDEIERMAIDLGQLLRANWQLANLRMDWRPLAPSGPQTGQWGAHFLWLGKLREIARPMVAENLGYEDSCTQGAAAAAIEADAISEAAAPAARRPKLAKPKGI